MKKLSIVLVTAFWFLFTGLLSLGLTADGDDVSLTPQQEFILKIDQLDQVIQYADSEVNRLKELAEPLLKVRKRALRQKPAYKMQLDKLQMKEGEKKNR